MNHARLPTPPERADIAEALVVRQAVSDANLENVSLLFRRPGEPFSQKDLDEQAAEQTKQTTGDQNA